MTDVEPMKPGAGGRSLGVPLLMVACCLYLPFAWILFEDASASYRLTWLKLWPILPGFVPGALLFHPNDVPEFATMGIVTVVLLAGLGWLGAGGRRRLPAAMALALLVSVPSSLMALAAFRF
jgi:hypothetical protein